MKGEKKGCKGSGLAPRAWFPLITCERGSAGSTGLEGSTVVVRRIKIWKRRGGLKLAVFSYSKPNPQPLIPSYQSQVTSHWLLIPSFKLVLQRIRRKNRGAYMGRCPKVSGRQACRFGFPHINRHPQMTKISRFAQNSDTRVRCLPVS